MSASAEQLEHKYQSSLEDLKQGRAVQAQANLEEILQTLPENPVVLERLGYCYAMQEKWDVAETYFHKAHHYAPENAEILNNLGCILQKQDKWEAASLCFSKALEKNPHNLAALKNLALCYQHTKKVDAAIKAYEHSLLLEPNDIAIRQNLAEMLFQADQFARAKDHNETLLQVAKNNEHAGVSEQVVIKAEIMLALTCFALGEEEKATQKIEALAQTQPDLEYSLKTWAQSAKQNEKHHHAAFAYGLLVDICPDNLSYLKAYILHLYISSQNTDKVEELLTYAMMKYPDDPVFPKTLSLVHGQSGSTLKALDAAKLFVKVAPHDPKAHSGYANLQLQTQKIEQQKIYDLDTPLQSYLKALQLCEHDLEKNLALAQAIIETKELEVIRAVLEAVSDFNPHEIFIEVLKSYVAKSERSFEQALACLQKASACAPDSSFIYSELANAFYYLNDPDQAIKASHKAVDAKKGDSQALQGHGILLSNCGLREEGLAANIKAVSKNPQNPDFQFSLGLQYLLRGDFEKGWPLYDNRLKFRYRNTIQIPPVPRWDGTPSSDLDLIVCCEQGLGDIIQFARFVPEVARRVGRTFFNVRGAVLHLFQPFADQNPNITLIEEDEKFKVSKSRAQWCPLMDLPWLLDVGEAQWADWVPYIKANEESVTSWRSRFDATKLNIGIAWQGNPNHDIDLGRSIPLHYFEPLSHIKNVQLVSLQKNHGLDQLEHVSFADRIIQLGDDFDNGDNAFADTVPAMQALDLIVTSDTSIAHLAGALGRPVWLGLRFASEWRWQYDREDSPWYPTMRLFRQNAVGNWADVMARMSQDLTQLADGDRSVLYPPNYT